MVGRTSTQLLERYGQNNAFGIIRVTGDEVKIVAHAMIHDEMPHIQKYGPFNLLRRHIYEVSTVFAIEKGSGYAAEAVRGLVKNKSSLRRRIKEKRFRPERYIALVRVDNTSSRRLFEKLKGSSTMSPRQLQELPQELLAEPVGSGENAYNFVGYDVTRVRRT